MIGGRGMSDEELVRLRPRDLAIVWGTAFGQLADLWIALMTALLEAGSGEREVPDGRCNEIAVRQVGGRTPRLTVQNLIGESFGKRLDGQVVTFRETGPGGPGFVLVDCCIDEARCGHAQGDIYRGEVVDEQGTLMATVALDAGS
jgi:hypothetical protein